MVSGEGSQDQVAPRGVEPGLPHPERRPQGNKNRQIDRKWRPDEHRRPVGLTLVPARARRNACKTLAASFARLSKTALRRVSAAGSGPRLVLALAPPTAVD